MTDAIGNVVLRSERGRFEAVDNTSIAVAEEFPQLEPFFASGSTDREFGNGTDVLARRVWLAGRQKHKSGSSLTSNTTKQRSET